MGWKAACAALALLLWSPALEAGAAGAEESKAAERRMVLEMEPLSVPVFARDKVLGQALVVIGLALEDPETRGLVRERMPRLMDAFFQYLYRDGSTGQFGKGILDLDRIKREFQLAADRILGAGIAEILIRRAQMYRR